MFALSQLSIDLISFDKILPKKIAVTTGICDCCKSLFSIFRLFHTCRPTGNIFNKNY